MKLSELPGDTCEFCGKDMPESRMITAKYCSRKCAVLANRQKEYLKRRVLSAERRSGATCPYCGGAFERKTRQQVYCRTSCKARSRYERLVSLPPPLEEEVPSSVCVICGASFRRGYAFRRIKAARLTLTCSKSCATRLKVRTERLKRDSSND